ncbi:hypothetical protein ThrDRAFT_04790 [Frankia casuarinae]|nr:hypothetical protein CcI6DRAFT_04193 [Frankia sp. CcI6]EYT89592.1 hypothetical protein ThrDRAFT_04790 [Frankia casuarinae]KDA40548.1 hypothetical protein BMG523Draft_04642 [Frankia sp. BMG5.23]KFB04602.1 hypothetical protein ALLO2DRAFT_02529 [Frankia sp. Allo2]OAA20832.1 hypothetical protein AAY23_108540 [Frankia casuarinae]
MRATDPVLFLGSDQPRVDDLSSAQGCRRGAPGMGSRLEVEVLWGMRRCQP